jgi:hypothetical protein
MSFASIMVLRLTSAFTLNRQVSMYVSAMVVLRLLENIPVDSTKTNVLMDVLIDQWQ